MSSPSTFQRTLLSIAVLGACGISQNVIAADDTQNILNTAPVVVTATRVEANSFDLPVSIDVVESESIHDGQAAMNLSESLIRVPGLTAQNRTQMAQDPEIATRGFGARSAFGVRGVRILVDGIPLTMPDGIGQPGNVDLEAVKSIEVMRGPFSSLYGSSSGGIIQLITAEAPKTPEVGFSFMAGSYGTTKEATHATGTVNGVEYLLNLDHYDTDGYRQHSAAWKDQATAKIRFNLSDDTKVTILANAYKSEAQDPLGLARTSGMDKEKLTDSTTSANTRSPYSNNAYYSAFTNPKSAPDAALLSNTRVSRDNTQIGMNLEHVFNPENTMNFIGSAGHRNNLQYLALPLNYTYNPTSRSFTSIYSGPSPDSVNYNDFTNSLVDPSKGRASSIARDFWSSEIDWVNKGEIFNKRYSVTTGIAYGWMNDRRQDINTSNGQMLSTSNSTFVAPSGLALMSFSPIFLPTNYQVNMNRDENDYAHNFDQFIQGKLSLTNALDIYAGLRHTQVNLSFKSLIPVSTSPKVNMNGEASFGKTTPVAGVVWKVNPALNFYANYGKGFETPTLIEMAYNSSFLPTGPNLSLKPSESDNYEAGVKTFISDNTRLNLAVFKTTTNNEIVISANSAYTVYGNADRTKRSGLEFSIDSQLQQNIGLYAAYTYLDAKFDSQYTTVVGGPSNTGGKVTVGNTIPGTYKQQLYAEVSWKYPALNFKTALEGRVNTKVYIDDVNSAAAPGYAVLNIRGGFEQQLSNWKVSEYLRIENIMDKSYIGAVRINDNNNRNYEAAAGRNWLIGLSASYRF
jgi:iron complex outermembrane receptor protein